MGLLSILPEPLLQSELTSPAPYSSTIARWFAARTVRTARIPTSKVYQGCGQVALRSGAEREGPIPTCALFRAATISGVPVIVPQGAGDCDTGPTINGTKQPTPKLRPRPKNHFEPKNREERTVPIPPIPIEKLSLSSGCVT
jgi:hypothetical protein